LAAKVAAEQDHDRFVALVKELNQLLEGDLRESQDSAPEGNADHNKPTVGKPYEKPTATKLTRDRAKLKLLSQASVGDQGEKDELLEEVFPEGDTTSKHQLPLEDD
jgi:hypothetical protein